jgi:FkbM family methyltransferase
MNTSDGIEAKSLEEELIFKKLTEHIFTENGESVSLNNMDLAIENDLHTLEHENISVMNSVDFIHGFYVMPKWKRFLCSMAKPFFKIPYTFIGRSQLLKNTAKRIVVKLIRWYISPIIKTQSDFNSVVLQNFNNFFHSVGEIKKLTTERLTEVQERQKILESEVSNRLNGFEILFNELKETQESSENELSNRLDDFEALLSELKEKQESSESGLLNRLQENEQNQRLVNATVMKLENDIDKIKNLGFDVFPSSAETGEKFFSQCGEDSITYWLLCELGILPEKITYLDLGANHAKQSSNSYFFYLKGARGVLVEANPALIQELKFYRHGDVILNRCVSDRSGELIDFYIFESFCDGLSTTDLKRAEECLLKNNALKMDTGIKVETISVTDIFENYFETAPTILNIDIEGGELLVLKSIDFTKYRPLIIIVEMIPYNSTIAIKPEKNLGIMALLEANDYSEMAFTGINSVFMDKKCRRQN